MGKNISVYLTDDQVNFINARKEGVSRVIRQAISVMMKEGKSKGGYDEVLAAAEEMRASHKLEKAIESWRRDRGDRW